jgi:epoxide hydrolase-like predicted phosphatase
MSARPIEAVVFDYGGVISSPLFRGIDEFEAERGYPRGSVLELVFGDASYVGVEGRDHLTDDVVDPHHHHVDHDWHRLEVGALSVREWFEGVQRRAPEVLGTEIDMDAYIHFMATMPVGVHWCVVHAARDLREQGLVLGLLTNNVAEWGENWRSTFPVDELFDTVVDSSAVRLRKPDRRIYLLTCERLGVDPEATVFVDDNVANCASARTLGMEAVLFGEDPFSAVAELHDILDRRGVAPRR